MEKKIVCHKCKSVLSPGSSYCPQCGERITQEDYVAGDTVLLNPIYLLPGTVLHMKYRINGVIGQGGFGITYDVERRILSGAGDTVFEDIAA